MEYAGLVCSVPFCHLLLVILRSVTLSPLAKTSPSHFSSILLFRTSLFLFFCLFVFDFFSFFPRNAFAVLLSMAGTLELEISQACLRSKSTYLSGRFFVGISSIYHVTY